MDRRRTAVVAALASAAVGLALVPAPSAGADGSVEVGTGVEFIAAFEDPTTDEIVLTAEITLAAEPLRPAGADPLVVEGNGRRINPAAGSAVMAAAGAVGDLTVRSIAVTGAGNSAIRWINGSVTVEDSSLTFNTSGSAGGAVFANGAPSVTISGSDISGNTADAVGGAVWTTGEVEVIDTTLDDNTAESGGAVSTDLGTGSVRIEGSDVVGNVANDGDGGAVQSIAGVTVIDSFFQANEAAGRGGAIWSPADAEVRGSSFDGNQADEGGAVASNSSVLLVNSTVSANLAASRGGGVRSGDTTLVFATVADNEAPTGANLASYDSDVLTAFGSVVAEPVGGPNCDGFLSTDSQGSNVEHAGDTCGFEAASDLGNAPDPLLGPLELRPPSFGRPPQAGSILIDAIDPASCAAAVEAGGVDQWGTARPAGAGCEIGAIEVEPDPEVPPTTEPEPQPEPVPPGTPPPAVPLPGSAAYTG